MGHPERQSRKQKAEDEKQKTKSPTFRKLRSVPALGQAG